MIEGALAELGGQKYLKAIALKYPVAFCTLLSKLIPKDLTVHVPVVPTKEGERYEVAKRIAYLLTEGTIEADKRAKPAAAKRKSKIEIETEINPKTGA